MGENILHKLVFRVGLSNSIFIGIFAVLSLYSIHLAGFLSLLPKALWPVIDHYFVSSLLIKLTTLLTLTALVSRFAPVSLILILETLTLYLKLIFLLFSRSGKRLITKKILQQPEVIYAQNNSGFAAKVFISVTKIQISFLSCLPTVFKSHHLTRILKRNRERTDRLKFILDHRSLSIQIFSAILALSALYIRIEFSILVAITMLFIYATFPPNRIMQSTEQLDNNNSALSQLNFSITDSLDIRKLAVMALSASFMLGSMHHLSLQRSAHSKWHTGNDEFSASLILSTTRGFLLYNAEHGHIFISNEITNFPR